VAHFDFAFEPRMAAFAYPLGVTPKTTGVDVGDGRLRARFGLWSLATSLDNVEAAKVTGPYKLVKVLGPPRMSLADRGITFATSTRQGVCIQFRRPVGSLRRTALTVTVADPEGLVEALR
jgi:hypothetical protein